MAASDDDDDDDDDEDEDFDGEVCDDEVEVPDEPDVEDESVADKERRQSRASTNLLSAVIAVMRRI